MLTSHLHICAGVHLIHIFKAWIFEPGSFCRLVTLDHALSNRTRRRGFLFGPHLAPGQSAPPSHHTPAVPPGAEGRGLSGRLLGTPRPASVTGRGRAGRGGPVWRVPGLGRFQGLRRPRASPPTVGSARAVPPGTSLTGGWGQCPPEGGDRKVIRVAVRFGER